MTRRFASFLLAATALLNPIAAIAAQPFSDAAFAKAQADGESIVVDVSAPWCPTCAAQKPTVQGLERDYPHLVVFNVDFDTEQAVLRRFRVQSQSTLIVFKGAIEAGRSTGQTDPQVIRDLVKKGL